MIALKRLRLIAMLVMWMLLGACNASRAGEPTIPARASLPERGAIIDYGYQIVREDYRYDAEGYVEGVTIWHGDSTVRYLSVVAETPPSLTSTPVPSTTPTATVIPTNMPRPTATDTPTVTPTPQPGPTQETTPQPTPQSTTFPKDTCYAGVISAGLNVRSNPSVEGVRYGVLAQADRVPVLMIHVVKPEGDPVRQEWGMIEYQGKTAWIALFYNGEELARLDDNERCWPPLMPIEYETAMAPMCLGWHSVPTNVDKNDMQASFVDWRMKGECVAAKGVEEIHAPELALAFGGIGAVRFPRGPTQSGDCANTSLPPKDAALDMARRILPIALTQAPSDRGFWLEGGNECQTPYFTNLPWLDAYLSAEIRAFNAYYPSRVIFGTMLAGAWTQERVNALRMTWDTALETGACLGIHAGGLPPEFTGGTWYPAIAGLTNSWLYPFTFQHRDIRRWLVQLNPAYVNIPFCLTEFASGGGWYPFQPQDYHSYAEEIQHDGVLFMAGFTAGTWNQFSINGHMAETSKLWQ